MTRNETKAMLAILKTAYPAFYSKMNRSEMVATVDLWAEMFADDDVNIVKYVLKELLADPREYPPNIGIVKGKIRDLTRAATGDPTDEELWRILKRALGNSLYGADEEFAKLPPVLQRYCGTPSTLRDLSMIDTETLNTVYHGQFLKQIGAIKAREEYAQSMPEELKRLLGGITPSLGEGRTISSAEWNDRRNAVLDQLEGMQYNTDN